MSFWHGATAQRLPLSRRVKLLPVVIGARILAHVPPLVLERALSIVRLGARPASLAECEAALLAVSSSSYRLSGPRACLPRSIAAALLCRCRGCWPEWHVGARSQPPFRAHAWLAVGNQLVLEPGNADAYVSLLSVKAKVPRRKSDTQS